MGLICRKLNNNLFKKNTLRLILAIFVALYSERNSEARQILYYEHTRISRKKFKNFGVRIQRGIANSPAEAVEAANN
jgi:hypothetical protein